MRQKVVIRALVRRQDQILLLKRIGGRRTIDGLYELPGGSLHIGEQPIDALKRSLQIHAGIEPEAFTLRDVISFIDPDTHDTQYIFIVYEATIGKHDRVTTDDEYSHAKWVDPETVDRNIMTDSTNVLLDVAKYETDITRADPAVPVKHHIGIIHSDGASRGNPGPSSSAYVITDHTGRLVLAQGGKYLGFNNSGMAEYTAVEIALEKAIEMGLTDIEFYSDNMMVVNQLNGIFRVNNPEYRDIHRRITKLMFGFRRIRFRHVHRELNTIADSLANRILDENT